MISFARGLVLRKEMRTLEFERDLGDGRIQFKYLDTFEVKTFEVSKIYKEILSGEITQVRAIEPSPRSSLDEPLALKLPSVLTPRQEAIIAFRMDYIRAAIRDRASPGSTRQLAEVISRLEAKNRPVDEAEAKLHRDFRAPSPWTLMNWLRQYQRSGNNAFLLCDMRSIAHKPKRVDHLVEAAIDQMIVKHYLQLRGKSIKATHGKVCEEIQLINRRDCLELSAPGEKTVSRRIHEIPEYVRDSKRYGPAFARNKWRFSMKGDQSTRILERVEIDHTLLDIWVLDPLTGVPLGRPWITVIMDRFSGYVLGVYISFYGPSSGTVSKAIRCSILPKSDLVAGIPEIDLYWSAMGVPETFVVDNGLEFHARVFRRIAWHLRADIIYNPVRQPWLKASIERVMMEFNRILPNVGKVFSPTKNAVVMKPGKAAAILFDDLCTCLLIWAAKVHPFHIHPKTLVRPWDLWEEGRQSAPPAMLPTDLSQLELAAGVADERTVGGDGVFFKYMRYNSLELQDYRRHHGTTFRAEIRFDPDNLGSMHVNLPKADKWIQVPLQRPSFEYGNGLSLLQHELIRSEARKRLTRNNAEEVLMVAKSELDERWREAISRGLRVRKDSDLIRAQGLTSAKLIKPSGAQVPTPQPVPEASLVMVEAMPEVMPFHSYNLTDDYE